MRNILLCVGPQPNSTDSQLILLHVDGSRKSLVPLAFPHFSDVTALLMAIGLCWRTKPSWFQQADSTSSSLVPRPPSEKSRKGLVTRMAMPRPRGIQSVTQSRVNVYTRGDNWSCAPVNSCMYSTKSSLNMSDTVPSRSTLLPRERRAAQYKSRITTGS